MRRVGRAALLVVLLMAGAGVAVVADVVRSGVSTRTAPGPVEVVLAHALRSLATPRAMRERPMPSEIAQEMRGDEGMTGARHHFADHCAVCHGNDGGGDTVMGRAMYPRTPDMRLRGTQSLTDGELYAMIHDGIRLSGMPAWGEAGEEAKGGDRESWELVAFVRHLPRLTAGEKQEMEAYNPQSRMEMQEQQQEEDFLNGKEVGK